MSQRRQNHSGKNHRPTNAAQRDKVRKRFLRVQGEPFVRSIHNDEDWTHVHRTGRILVCPDDQCTQRLSAKMSQKKRRFLSDVSGSSCNHFVSAGGGGPMTDEHLWLQQKLLEICRELGFAARLEVGFSGACVDLHVDSTPPYAFEVQRVSTNFTARRKAREWNGMQTLWFLPESARQKNTGKGKNHGDPLFTEPCVRLGYRVSGSSEVPTANQLRSIWQGDSRCEVQLHVGVTIGKLSPDRRSFTSTQLPLTKFISQVLNDERRWYKARLIRGRQGGMWAGWLLNADVAKYEAAIQAADEERQRRETTEKKTNADCADLEELNRAAGEHADAEQAAVDDARIRDERTEASEDTPHTAPPARVPPEPDAQPFVSPVATREPWWKRIMKLLIG
ncbi:hypothetical protein [Zhihengliuella halotolerans]|uniref:Competence protein CoiA-like protein n=1 Tax=Zhihengliuella halotolerans TaxID=370736 RepID=A0A4V2GA93_9MICC|nr:hypothetical protein [Zhihengliuella halotolerans]RZU63356.1 hypothetical protein EV380_2973 [Zhihengliuella halotolerans]